MWVLPGKKWVCSREWDYYVSFVAVVNVVVFVVVVVVVANRYD